MKKCFKSGGHSFPSGKATAIISAIARFVPEYGLAHPSVYMLELPPLYDSNPRMKSQVHWQTDVIGGRALGTAVGYYADFRNQRFTVMMLTHGLTGGWRKHFQTETLRVLWCATILSALRVPST